MRRAAPLVAALLALLAPAGAAGDDGATFVVVDQPTTLPSADAPNRSTDLVLPVAFTTPPAFVERLSVAELRPIWQQAGAAYGIPWNVLAAINKIETNFGENMGPSSAGAVGWMQFMPETWLRWGMDADADGVADPWDPDDAIYAAARYLAAAGGREDVPRSVFAYNHAQWYVDDVLALASVYAGGTIETPFDAGLGDATTGMDVASAETLVAELRAALDRAVAAETRLAAAEMRAQRRVDHSGLLSDQLLEQKRLTLVAVRRGEAASAVARLREELAAAEAALTAARAGALAAPFGLLAGSIASVPSAGGYAFPVGGGAATVSVSPDHHDYPAADIAAPFGAPVYAHADGVVVRGWSAPEGRCGIGFTMQSGDGRQWTYCHLSYLEPTVTSGALLLAGAAVGLVGSTGHSTGPHLHLQLSPPVSYPQAEPWFLQHAGSAFSWQGSAPTAPAPLFAVVPEAEAPATDLVLFTTGS